MGTSVSGGATPARLDRAASTMSRAFCWALPALLACVLMGGGGCQYLSARNETVGSALYKGEPDIRVRVRKGADNAHLDGPGRVMVRTTTGGAGPMTLETPLSVVASVKGIALTDGTGETHELGLGNSVEIVVVGGAEGQVRTVGDPGVSDPGAGAKSGGGKGSLSTAEMVKLDGAPLPGMVTLRPRTDEGQDRFDVIATMPMETYLPGVLEGELYASWPIGAFEIQAVAARTYALHQREGARRQGSAFDVESTTADQVFRGLTKNPVAIDAARRTRGQVVTWKGQLIKAYYSSTCGGEPASAGDVWPTGPGFEDNSVPPLRGGPRTIYCQASPYFKWEVTRGDDDVSERIRAWGAANGNDVRRMGRLRKAEMTRANKFQRPVEFKLTDDRGGTYKIGAEQLRTACNFPVPGQPAITRETRVPSGDTEVTLWADQVKFTGKGFGHGVGMCQWCAKGMGERGLSYQMALEQFYPGAKVSKAY